MKNIFYTLIIFCSLATQANEAERVEISKFLTEFKKIQIHLIKAKSLQDKNVNERLRFDLLQQDLKLIEDGLNEYLQSPHRKPSLLNHNLKKVTGTY